MAKIIVIDDEEGVAKIIRLWLEKEGHEVLTGNNGLEGFKLIEKENPDLVITDQDMPGLTGLEIARKTKKSPKTSKIPVIIMSGRETPIINRKTALEAGAKEFLTKPPSSFLNLINIIKNILSSSQ